MFRDITYYDEKLVATRPIPRWRITPCQLSATAYSIYSYIRSYPPYWVPFLHPRFQEVPGRAVTSTQRYTESVWILLLRHVPHEGIRQENPLLFHDLWCTVHEPQASYADKYAKVYLFSLFLLLSSLFNFVCFSFTLFLVVVAAFCADDADKSLPVEVEPMIFLYCLQSSTKFVQLSFSQHVSSFAFSQSKTDPVARKLFVHLHTVFLFGTRQSENLGLNINIGSSHHCVILPLNGTMANHKCTRHMPANSLTLLARLRYI